MPYNVKQSNHKCLVESRLHTFLVIKLVAELFDQLIDLGVHNHLVLIANAVFTQKVEFDVVIGHAFHILNLPQVRKQLSSDMATILKPLNTPWKSPADTFLLHNVGFHPFSSGTKDFKTK